MSAASFRSVFMVASCAGAALGCYLVSLHVASERAELQEVERKIVMAERDIRLIETEIGTRGRLAQLERWNVKVLALSAPTADQFLDGEFQLASLMRPQPKVGLEAPVVLASASTDTPRPQVPGASEEPGIEPDEATSAEELLHVASLTRPERPAATRREASKPATTSVAGKSVRAGQAVEKKAGDKRAKAGSDSVTKAVRTASVDPLAPLSADARSRTKETDSAR